MVKKLNITEYRNKVSGCWFGKNIGGTLGAPVEGKREINDFEFYQQNLNGAPVPNDDLDLQLIWLIAAEIKGIYQLSPRILGDFWMGNISCPSGEYAICRANIANGLYPPLSGSSHNDALKYSNGAWIRSEIWACIFPGCPDEAIKFAWMDACADHVGEGIYAEMFTVALESAAFVEKNIRVLIDIALSKIPDDCRVSRSVKLVIDCYEQGKDWEFARQKVVEDSTDLGWFQAPGNLGFMTIGLLYGEGDFGKTICRAVNCGDDSDCTAATAGAIMGIIGGEDKIPTMWKDPIGESIKTIAVTENNLSGLPKTIQELTLRTERQCKIAQLQNSELFILTDQCSSIPDDYISHLFSRNTSSEIWNRSCNELLFPLGYLDVAVDYDNGPDCLPGKPKKIIFKARMYNCTDNQLYFSWHLPCGWDITPNCGTILIRDWFENSITCELIPGEFSAAYEYLTLEVGVNGRQNKTLLQIPVALSGSVIYPNIRVDYHEFAEVRKRLSQQSSSV